MNINLRFCCSRLIYFSIAFLFSTTIGKCHSFEYRCSNDRCIDNSVNCNGLNPCGDFSDCHLSGAAIAGIVVGSMFVTCVCLTLVLVWFRNKRGPPAIKVSWLFSVFFFVFFFFVFFCFSFLFTCIYLFYCIYFLY